MSLSRIKVISIAFLALSASTSVLAQQPAKDRKDLLIEALESQRNDGLAKLAICYADANEQIGKLNARVQGLSAELEEAKKKAPAEVPK